PSGTMRLHYPAGGAVGQVLAQAQVRPSDGLHCRADLTQSTQRREPNACVFVVDPAVDDQTTCGAPGRSAFHRRTDCDGGAEQLDFVGGEGVEAHDPVPSGCGPGLIPLTCYSSL